MQFCRNYLLKERIMAKKSRNAISQNTTVCFNTLATSSKVSSKQVNSTNYAGGLSTNIAMRCTTKTGMLLFSTFFLLLFMFAVSDVKAGGCPDNLPDQKNPWKKWITFLHDDPYSTGSPNVDQYSWVDYNGCRFYFEVCARILDVPEYFVYNEYYISEVIPSKDCKMNDADIIFNYKNIIDAYMERFAEFLWTGGGIRTYFCDDPADPPYNLLRVGYPSCITAPYTVTSWRGVELPPGSGVWGLAPFFSKTITSCNSSSAGSCYSRYKYCRDRETFQYILKKVYDGSDAISCPSDTNVAIEYDLSIRYAKMPCHPVCSYKYNYTQPDEVSSIEAATTANLSISPNPTNNSTTLTFEVLEAGNLNLILVDATGKEMLELYNATVEIGTFTKNFTMSNLPVGVYYLRIALNNKIKMEKVIRN